MIASNRPLLVVAVGAVVAVVALASLSACSNDGEPNLVGAVAAVPDARIQYFEPRPNEERVGIDHRIRASYNRHIDTQELNATRFFVNEVPAKEVVHRKGPSASSLTIVPEDPLEYHKTYVVTVEPQNDVGLRAASWKFATDPGPAGGIWERIDASIGKSLYAIGRTSNGFIAGGEDGVMVFSPWGFGWDDDPIMIGERAEQTEDIKYIFEGGTRVGALTADGSVYLGTSYFGTHMERWNNDPDHFILGMWGLTHVLVGELRSAPNEGFITSSYPGDVTLTGNGRVMRAATSGFDGASYYLAVGDDGSIFYSRDKVTWADVNYAPAWGDFTTVMGAYTAGDPATSQNPHVAVAAGSKALVWSEDGQEWHLGVAPFGLAIHDITWNGYPLDRRQFIAVGDAGRILTSADGKFWDVVDTGLDLDGVDFYAAAGGYPQWVVVGKGGATVISPPRPIRF